MNIMHDTNKDKVRSRYQHASAEQESTGEWGVWDISHDERKRLNEKFWPETFGRGLFGLGRTEAEAWANAVRTIEQREVIPFLEREIEDENIIIYASLPFAFIHAVLVQNVRLEKPD